MKKCKNGERFFMSSVKLGPKGQIVIPKEARDMFSLAPGDTVVLLADKSRGMVLQTVDQLEPMVRETFLRLPEKEEEEDSNECT